MSLLRRELCSGDSDLFGQSAEGFIQYLLKGKYEFLVRQKHTKGGRDGYGGAQQGSCGGAMVGPCSVSFRPSPTRKPSQRWRVVHSRPKLRKPAFNTADPCSTTAEIMRK